MILQHSNVTLLDEQILEPGPTKLTIEVRPVIYSVEEPNPRWPNKPSPTWYCTFDIQIGKDTAWEFPFTADGSHDGERIGPHWEETKALWQKQYDYIRKHIVFMILTTNQLLAREAAIECYRVGHYSEQVQEFDWRALLKDLRAAIRPIDNLYGERLNETFEQGDWAGNRAASAASHVLDCVAYNLSLVFHRLCGEPVVSLGENSDLRYTATRLERLRLIIGDFKIMWNAVSKMVESKRRRVYSNSQPFSDEEWESVKEQVKQAYNKPPDRERFRLGGIPDHLLDELRPLPWDQKFRTSELAYVHAAIECGIHLPGPTWPVASNWKIIYNLIRTGASR